MATQTISKRTVPHHSSPIRPYRDHPGTTQAHSILCPLRPPPDSFLMASPHSARLYAPPLPVFWFARSLKRAKLSLSS